MRPSSPAATAERSSVAGSVATTTTASSSATEAATAASTATVAGHLGQTRIDLLLRFSQDADEIARLLGIYKSVSEDMARERSNILSVVKRVMAVPLRPARPVLPIR